ncbi:MAG: hypothetical protein LLF86_05225, partial [Nitrospiraceae bacterium]|nr:hypothetical protein [Nitrospiraceae bacterium]
KSAPNKSVPAGFADQVSAKIDAIKNRKGDEKIVDVRTDLQKAMMDKCSVFRNEKDLTELVAALGSLKERAKHVTIKDTGEQFNTNLLDAVELEHLVNLGDVIARSALQRTESRGGHSREDYPKRDDVQWLKHTFAFKKDGDVEFRYKPVVIKKFQPVERKY